jgi:uncharacterized protein
MRILRAVDRLAIAWKNGGGVTREVASFPPNAGLENFDWRISIADVRDAGPFSHFDHIDRNLTVISGRLEICFGADERKVILEPGMSLAFAGEAPIEGAPVDGPVRDLNIMVRRGAWRARVAHQHSDVPDQGERIGIAMSPSTGLDSLDALVLDEGEKLPTDFSGLVVVLERSQ